MKALKSDRFDEIESHWRESTLMPLGTSGPDRALTDEWDYARDLMFLRKTLIRVMRSKKTLFKEVHCRKNCAPRCEAGALGRSLISCIQLKLWGIRSHYPQHRLDPYFELFFRLVNDSPLCWRRTFDDATIELNNLVEKLRVFGKKLGFLASVANIERAAAKNATSLTKFFDRLFRRYSKLLIVRVDLGYIRDGYPDTRRMLCQVPDVARHRLRIIRWVRATFPTLVGYVWKIEYGALRGFHVHLLLVCNGQKSRQGVTIGRVVGEHWVTEVTGGTGNYWNVNCFENDYEKKGLRGIGLISHSDYHRRDKLLVVARYLAKVDYFVRLECPGLNRVFGKSMVRKSRLESRGRPRHGSETQERLVAIFEQLDQGPMPKDPDLD